MKVITKEEKLSIINENEKQKAIALIKEENKANNPLTLSVEVYGTLEPLDITFNGGDSSASAIKGAIDFAQMMEETTVTLWDINNINYEFDFDTATTIMASIAHKYRDEMFLRNEKIKALG